MPVKVVMLALSPTMKEGKLVKWLVKEGDLVEPGDVLAEIETDKAIMELESVDQGTVGKLLVNEGSDGIAVNSIIALLLKKGESKESLDLGCVDFVKERNSETDIPSVAISNKNIEPEKNSNALETSRVLSSPLARRIAKDDGVDIRTIFPGSGPRGRVIARDLEAHKKNIVTQELNASACVEEGSPKLIAHTPMRRVIASSLSDSKKTIPHFYLKITCNVGRLIDLRQEMQSSAHTSAIAGETSTGKVSINDFFVKALAHGFRDVQDANVVWHDNEFMRIDTCVNIGIAVSIDGGLITPVIRDADNKSLRAISIEASHLISKARNRELKVSEYQGASSIVSNLGMYGIEEFYAIISPGQSTILSVGAVRDVPLIENGSIICGKVVTIVLSVDHRALDGVVAAKLLSAVKFAIEHPVSLLS